ncbi:lipocalin family protein [Halpernia frigidisoli]|uniref:Lipocalin-like domain-containing protein n=1 Tax=Halpernia frigidisoli TaxID=1125876 RepID=A0A1I3E6I0_9FLAO|nr:lipocalin family protein [Halpernia frigidisoli]SFH94488.1 Lipocalin-like domain-containing protein [Halpernia frigidisoli]
MKNLLLTGIVSVFALTSCSTAKMAQTNRAEFLKMKGDWQITSIDYDKSFKIKPFDENADASCFVGSNWRFIPNNYSGAYTINGGGSCPTVSQPIKIDVISGNQFMFKKLVDGTKAKNVTSGYALDLLNQSTDQFSLQQNIPFEGQNVKVTYNFQRTSMK